MSVTSGHHRIILLGMVLSLFLVFTASACSETVLNNPGSTGYRVSKISIEPDGPLTQGTPVIVSFKVDFPADENGVTFPNDNILQFSTDLDRATWEYYLVLNGREELQPRNTGHVLVIYGEMLNNPGDVEESLVLRLEGKAPAVQHTKNITIIKIQQGGDCGRTIGTIVEYNTMVFNVSEVSQIIGQVQSNLSQFRNHIDEKAAIGINTTDAAIKYQTAKEKFNASLNSSPNHVPDAYNSLIASETAINEGESLLDKAWAGKIVADAENQLNKANNTIDTIHANLSSSNDKRLSRSYAKRDAAISDIALARDKITQGDFPLARGYAYNAYEEANASYNEAVDAEKRIANPLNALPLSLPVTCLAVLGALLIVMRIRGRD
jgi:hypothetical protein